MTADTSSGPAIGIAGFGQIGRVHARVLERLGARIVTTLSSRSETACASAEWATRHLDHPIRAVCTLDELLSQPLDGVVICTPPALHLDHLLRAFDAGLPVFCEKPLLWRDGDTTSSVCADLERLRNHPKRDLLVNTSNTVFLDAVGDRLGPIDAAQSFFFRFHTRGPYRGLGIAEDLLPHGLSLLIHRYGVDTLSGAEFSVTPTTVVCRFGYGERSVEFDFREETDANKALAFGVGDHLFDRVQEGQGDSYRVWMRDASSDERVASPDPFVVYAQRFIDRCGDDDDNGGSDAFELAAANATLMAQLLTAAQGA